MAVSLPRLLLDSCLVSAGNLLKHLATRPSYSVPFMISLLGSIFYDDEYVATEAKQRFGKFLADANDVASLPSDMRITVFRIFLKNGGDDTEYKSILKYFDSATGNAERKHMMTSLGSAPRVLSSSCVPWNGRLLVRLFLRHGFQQGGSRDYSAVRF